MNKKGAPFHEELPQEGAPFLFTFVSNRMGFNPKAIDQRKTPCVHHSRICALNFNEYERITEQCQVTLPKLIYEIQAKD